MQPETDAPQTLGTVKVEIQNDSVNVIEAAASGASAGMKLAINVAAMLIAFLALIALANTFLGWLSVTCLGIETDNAWTLERAFSYVFYPFAWLMGIPKQDCMPAGELLGLKMVANEFIAFDRLGAGPSHRRRGSTS
ncbi:MAG: nucleoside transporter C-terminal domain-containing protein [Pirellulaceae bacterium]